MVVIAIGKRRRVKRKRIRQPLDPSIRYIPLTQGQKATVDAEDYEFLMSWNWSAKWDDSTQGYYARRRVQAWEGLGVCHVGMHNVLKGCYGGKIVDHRDGDGLNMRKTNLRPASSQQNAFNHPTRKDNRLGIKGVRQQGNRYEVRISVNGNRKSKMFASISDALTWRAEMEQEVHGEFRRVAA
jgi:hypothetical protein